MFTVADIYSTRFCDKLPLPRTIQENIAKLRISPAYYRPIRPRGQFHKKHQNPASSVNWRETLLVDIVRRVKEREDPEYSEVFSIFNKITKSNLEKLSNDIVTCIGKRDDTFCLRVSTLLFDKAITNHVFASVMADCSAILVKAFPDVLEDLRTQIGMFDSLYNMNDTIVYSEDNVVEWTKQKEKRKGFAKFVMELYIRNLVTEEVVQRGLEDVVRELQNSTQLSKSEQTDENIHQFAVFLFETSKLIPKSNLLLRISLKKCLSEFLTSTKVQMKTKFKLEDALKQVS